MPSFAEGENDAPVLIQPPHSAATFGKDVSSTISSRPIGHLTSVDANVSVHGNCLPRPYPPPPACPPPSLPPPLVDGAYYRRPSTAADSDDISTSSSADMTGYGGGSSNGGPASSHATTSPPDEDASYYGKDIPENGHTQRFNHLGSVPGRPSSSSSSLSLALSLTQPSRPPPPPPTIVSQPLARSPGPPLPPKSKFLTNGGPISIPNPLADRTRIVSDTSQSHLSPQRPPQSQSHADRVSDDYYQARNSAASTVGSSILSPSAVDMYVRQGNRPDSTSTGFSNSNNTNMPSAGVGSEGAPRSQFSSTLSPHSQQSAQPPHRFSSPPAYAPGTGSTGTGGSFTPVPLKQRHTLEVPKSTPARNSRDGTDAATLASGRFSPTAAGGSTGSISGSLGGRRASLSLVRRNTRSMHSDMPRDEVVPDEDALRWTEAYRQKRASKKRRLEQDDDQVLVGTKVDETHANWVAAYNMLTGIRVSVSRTNAKLDRPLTDEDFQVKQKSTFDIAGNELVPSAKYDFKFKDYAPWVFRHLRALFHLDPADYLMSLAGKYILSELGSPGKSGSFFYFSRDYKYIIKTIHHSEHKFLRKILKEYYLHVKENPNTLLSQFFGLHRVKMPYGRKIHFVVMNNLFPPHRDIHQTFDLKGSTIGRDYPEERLAENPRATLKDLNWMRRHENLELGMVKKRLFLEQLEKDVKLLQRLQIMDYSLLVGVHDLRRGNEENLRGKTLQVFEPGADSNHPDADAHSVLMRTPSRLEHQRKARELRQMLKAERPIPIDQSTNRMPDELDDSKQSVFYKDNGGFQATHENNAPADEVYYLGVIDCLTHYGMIKKIEHFWKGLSSDRTQISALPPQHYGDRFFNFVTGVTKSPEAAAQERADAEIAKAAAAMATAAEVPEAGGEGGADVPAIATTSGRDKGKETVQTGVSWSSTVRHRNARTSGDGGMIDPRGSEEGSRMAVPSLVLGSPVSSSGGSSSSMALGIDRRESVQQPSLPMVNEEAGEGSSAGSQGPASRPGSRSSRRSFNDERPRTPAKDARFSQNNGSGNNGSHGVLSNGNPAYLKPDSADSGYGVSGGTRSRSGTVGTIGTVGSGRKVKVDMGRDSLDKALPPLPRVDGTA